jgi:hypothetical protein
LGVILPKLAGKDRAGVGVETAMMRGPVSFVLVGLLLAAGVGVFALGSQRIVDMVPDPVVRSLADIGIHLHRSGPGASRASAATPAEALVDGPDGLMAEGPIAALAGNAPVFIDAVIAGHAWRVGRDIPSEVTTIRPIMGCLLTPPLSGTLVGHVTAGTSDLGLALSTYGDADLARGVAAFVERYRATGAAEAQAPADLAYQAYDVAVTETQAPVYLVLEGAGANRIWNIHLAPGARVERVVLLGGTQAGVANLDPVVPVEVLLDDGLAACGIAPAHPFNPGHKLATSGGAEAAAARSARDLAVAAYDRWFRDSFGIGLDARAGFDRGMVSVVGSVPGDAEPKALYTPVKGAKIRTTQGRYFEIAGQVPDGQDFAARVRALVSAFAGGDLASLRQGAEF